MDGFFLGNPYLNGWFRGNPIYAIYGNPQMDKNERWPKFSSNIDEIVRDFTVLVVVTVILIFPSHQGDLTKKMML